MSDVPAETGTVFVVTTVADDGAGSLRDAIEQANAAGGECHIEFAIEGPATVSPLTPLPAVGFSGSIDGTTQPGYDGEPVVALDGGSAADGSGLVVRAPGVTVRGLAVGGWPGYGVLVDEGAHDARILGCRIGTDPAGRVAVPNRLSGVRVIQAGGAVIGGPGADEGNVLSGNGQNGLEVVGPESGHAVVVGNVIGTDAAGSDAVPNQHTGILVTNTSWVQIGGPDAGDANVVSGNLRGGITIDGGVSDLPDYPYSRLGQGHHNLVQGNLIGPARAGGEVLGNGLRGVLIHHAHRNSVIDNVIAGHAQDGVLLLGPEAEDDPLSTPAHNLIVGNHIRGNGRHGVFVRFGRHNQVGADTTEDANVIEDNGGRGVMFSGIGARTNVLSSDNLLADNAMGAFHQPRE